MNEQENIVELLEEGISMEEIPTLTNLKKMKEILHSTSMDEDVKRKLLKKIRKIQSDSIKHSSIFNKMLGEVEKDE